jgi:hypothetical protein
LTLAQLDEQAPDLVLDLHELEDGGAVVGCFFWVLWGWGCEDFWGGGLEKGEGADASDRRRRRGGERCGGRRGRNRLN